MSLDPVLRLALENGCGPDSIPASVIDGLDAGGQWTEWLRPSSQFRFHGRKGQTTYYRIGDEFVLPHIAGRAR